MRMNRFFSDRSREADMFLKYIPKKRVILLLGDVFLIACSCYLSVIVTAGWHGNEFEFTRTACNAFLCTGIFYVFDLYNTEKNFLSLKYVVDFFLAILAVLALDAMIFLLLPSFRTGRELFFMTNAMIAISTFQWRVLFKEIFKSRLVKPLNVLIIDSGAAGRAAYYAIKDRQDYNVVGFLDADRSKWGKSLSPTVLGGFSLLKNAALMHDVNAVVVANASDDDELLKNTREIKMNGMEVYNAASFYEELFGKIPVEHLNDFWFVSTQIAGVRKNFYNLRIKRVLDFALSMTGLVVTLPVGALAAILIKLESRGPVFYRQKRVGLKGMPFYLFKFRSMECGREDERALAGSECDPRITRIGRIIRTFRIDEIPQMWNVLKGEMSFIGPRALIEDEVNEFERYIPYFSIRHCVKPGITGWAQVNYPHGKTLEDAREKIQYDLFYIKNSSLFLDIYIILKTVQVVLLGKGAK